MNLLHDIDAGTRDEINVIIEIPKGSHNKYEVDKATGLIKLDRANFGPAPYPTEYGFIPQTLAEDGDAADVLLLATYPIHPGILVAARPVALMEMTDGGETDNKIIAVPVEDRRFEDVHDLADLNKHTLKEIQHFFETIKQLKGKPVVVMIHGFKGKEAAQAEFDKCRKFYEEKK
jgi:inorganic pyrophosphatase